EGRRPRRSGEGPLGRHRRRLHDRPRDRRVRRAPHRRTSSSASSSGSSALMGAGRHRPLTIEADSYVHRPAPDCKRVATVLFVFAVVVTPREAGWAFALYALALVGVARFASVPLPTLGRRLAIETPFVAFALLLPIVGGGPRAEVLGVPLSVN